MSVPKLLAALGKAVDPDPTTKGILFPLAMIKVERTSSLFVEKSRSDVCP